MQRVNFEVPRSKRLKLKILAARRGQSVKEFLTDYIDSFPDEQSPGRMEHQWNARSNHDNQPGDFRQRG